MENGSRNLAMPMKTVSYLSNIPLNYFVYGTMKGSVGVVAIIPEKVYELLHDLQDSILADMPKGFGMDYNKWRSFKVKLPSC